MRSDEREGRRFLIFLSFALLLTRLFLGKFIEQMIDPNANDRYTLVRGLGLIAAVSVIIGNVIGTGVFLKARVMTCNVGTPGWVIAAWIAGGLLSLAGALTYAELTAMRPMAGAQNVFLQETYGRPVSFLFGWMQVLIAKPA